MYTVERKVLRNVFVSELTFETLYIGSDVISVRRSTLIFQLVLSNKQHYQYYFSLYTGGDIITVEQISGLFVITMVMIGLFYVSFCASLLCISFVCLFCVSFLWVSFGGQGGSLLCVSFVFFFCVSFLWVSSGGLFCGSILPVGLYISSWYVSFVSLFCVSFRGHIRVSLLWFSLVCIFCVSLLRVSFVGLFCGSLLSVHVLMIRLFCKPLLCFF